MKLFGFRYGKTARIGVVTEGLGAVANEVVAEPATILL
jgi:hypothetical protein